MCFYIVNGSIKRTTERKRENCKYRRILFFLRKDRRDTKCCSLYPKPFGWLEGSKKARSPKASRKHLLATKVKAKNTSTDSHAVISGELHTQNGDGIHHSANSDADEHQN